MAAAKAELLQSLVHQRQQASTERNTQVVVAAGRQETVQMNLVATVVRASWCLSTQLAPRGSRLG